MLRLAVKNSLTKSRIIQSTNSSCKFHDGKQLQQAGFGKILAILTPIAAGAGVVAYAKYDSKFRQTLVQNVPGIDPVLKVLLQEKGNALDQAKENIDNASKTINEYTSKVTGIFGSTTKPNTATSTVPISKSIEKSPVVPSNITSSSAQQKPELLKVPAPPLDVSVPISSEPATTITKTVLKPEKNPSSPKLLPTPPSLPKNITELEHMVEVAARTAVIEYEKAVQILKSYNNEVQNTLEQLIEKQDNSVWASLKNKTSVRDTAVLAAESAAHNAVTSMEKLEKSMSTIKDAPSEQIDNVRNSIQKYKTNLNRAKEALYDGKDSAKITEKYWKNIESARNYFINEMEALFPGIDLSEKKLNLSKDDIDLFILYVHSHVLAYQKELEKLHIDGETRLNRAIDALRGDDQTEAINQQLKYYLEKEKQDLNIENQKKFFKIQAENEKRLREQLKLHSRANIDYLNDALTQKEKELRRIFNRELSEKLSSEQAAYKTQLATMLGKLKGMDAALKDRADADRQVHQAQSLWSACQALWASVRAGEPGESLQKRIRPLSNEVAAVRRAGDGDELVAAVLKGVPEEAKKRGVYSEEALRERFFKVDKMARRVALVPEKGAGLPLYALSYLQSIFILTPSELITKAELNNEPFDFSQLDTFDILNRARYWIERGNLIESVKYMNLLSGAPRKVAKDWLKEARLLLETQQATNTLMAHAATSGLSFL